MASPSGGPEYHLTCGICCQDFDRPVTLECLHSYCQDCIQTYIDCRSKQIEADGYFCCPVCDDITEKTDDSFPINRWSEKLQPSQFLKCLADTISGKTSDDLCSLCSEETNIVKAIVWCHSCHDGLCESCSLVHGKMKVSKSHSTVPIDNVSKQERNKSGNPNCALHPEQCVQFYCEQCCGILCQTCAIINHRKCKNITNISGIAKRNRTELHQSLNEIKNHVTMAEKKITKLEAQSSKLSQSQQETETAIKQYVNDMIRRLRQSEKELLDSLGTTCETASCQLLSREVNTKKTYTALRHVEKFIASVITMGSDSDVLNNSRLIEIQKQRLTDNQAQSTELPICVDMKFVSDSRLTYVIASSHIGCVKPQSSYKLKRIETNLEGESKGDSCAIDLVIVTIKEEHVPIIVDGTNNCVKLLTEIPQKISLRNPRRIEKLSNYTVIVTSSKHVNFIDVQPHFEVTKMVETQTDYTGIAVIGKNRLAASRWSFAGGCFVDIIDFAGNVLQKLVLKDLLDPSYLSTTLEGNILVSDCRSKALTCVTHTGEIIFTYKSESGDKVKLPYGVCCSKDDCIYLADFNGAKVIKLGRNGEYLEDCLTKAHGIDRPRGVAFDDVGNLYICHCKGWINVFRVS